MDELKTAEPFLISLGIGLMMGLERERRPGARTGLRSFAMIALLGTTLTLLSQELESYWILAGGLLLVGTIMIMTQKASMDRDEPDIITTFAAILCFCLGAMLWLGHRHLVVALALAAVSLMHFKTQLHGLSHKLTDQDLLAFLQFSLISFIVLPLLPNQGYGPYAALNPFTMWLMVVLISGLSLAGYIVLRIFGEGRGVVLLGILGGLVSSTATTMVYARQVRQSDAVKPAALTVILVATLVVQIRLAIVAVILARDILPLLLPVMGLGLVTGAAYAYLSWRALTQDTTNTGPLVVANPVSLRAALSFGALFGLVLLATAWLQDIAGTGGVYLVALVSGLTDVDVITLSALQMFESKTLAANEVIHVIVIACVANLLSKAVIVAAISGRAILMPVLRGFTATGIGLGLGVWLFN